MMFDHGAIERDNKRKRQERLEKYAEAFAAKLAGHENIARYFNALYVDVQKTAENHSLGPGRIEAHIRCRYDQQSILNAEYRFTIDELQTKLIAHLLQCHREMMGEVESGEYGETKTIYRNGSDDSADGNSGTGD